MKIWLISVNEFPGYDSYSSHVIAAPSSRMVRAIASSKSADEGKEVWLDKRKSHVTCIAAVSKYTEPTIVLSDFNAG